MWALCVDKAEAVLVQDVVAVLHQLRAEQDKTTQGGGDNLKWDIEMRMESRTGVMSVLL